MSKVHPFGGLEEHALRRDITIEDVDADTHAATGAAPTPSFSKANDCGTGLEAFRAAENLLAEAVRKVGVHVSCKSQ